MIGSDRMEQIARDLTSGKKLADLVLTSPAERGFAYRCAEEIRGASKAGQIVVLPTEYADPDYLQHLYRDDPTDEPGAARR